MYEFYHLDSSPHLDNLECCNCDFDDSDTEDLQFIDNEEEDGEDDDDNKRPMGLNALT